MGRLHCILVLTPDVARQRAFYETQLGLEVSRSDDGHAAFVVRGAPLMLRAVPESGKAELRLAITARPLESRLAVLKSRGAVAEGDVVEDEFCRTAIVRDPEGNAVQLVEPRVELAAGRGERLSHAIVSAKKFVETAAFYREVIGLKVAEEDPRRIEFDTGETRLVVQARDDANAPQLPKDQRIAFAFEEAELETWAAELRERGVAFASSPAETVLGLEAEVEDADGWFVVLHGPAPEELPDEDELDAEYGAGDDDDRGLPRRGGELGGNSDKRKYTPPSKLARKQAARAGKAPAPEPDRGGFVPRSSRPYAPRPEGAPRPYTPRPDGAPRPYTPRPEGASRPYTPRPEGAPRPYTPRPEGASRPYTPRPDGPSRPQTPRPGGPPRDAGPRPGPRPAGPPRTDRDRSE